MKRVVVLFFLAFFLCGCNKNLVKLDSKYYKESSFIDVSKDELNDLISKEESFMLFIYQPLCQTSYEFNTVVTRFSKEYQMTIYKIEFEDVKKTSLGEDIKYYPSFAIVNKGKLVDFLKTDKDEHINYYKSSDGLSSWIDDYIKIKKVNSNYEEESKNEEVSQDIKIDAVLENVTYSKDKVNIYFFWGDGCPHCEAEFKFFESIKNEYGDYFTLNPFEVWHNSENAKLLNQFTKVTGVEAEGVPYTIIGKEIFTGFNDTYKSDILDAIKKQYKNSYDVYFDSKNVKK